MRFDSIKFQAMLLLVLALTIPVIVVGGAGILYYRGVIKQNIWDDNLAQAKAIAKLTDTYIEMGQTYLVSISDRPLVIKALNDNNQSFMDYTTAYTVNNSHQFDVAYITDTSGKIISCYPPSNLTGKNVIGESFVIDPIKTDKPSVSDGMRNDITGMPTVYIGVPIDDESGKVLGVIVGGVNLHNYSSAVVDTQVTNSQYIFLVNRTGHVMQHSNQSYMNEMTDFSMLPAVQNVINGSEGTGEQYFPFENDYRLTSYAPVPTYGWGVVVSLPVDVAYKPVTDSTTWFVGFLILLLLLSIPSSFIAGGYITDPVARISSATKQIPDGEPQKLEGTLPVARRDEIGELARSVLAMANTIKIDRESIIKAKSNAEKASVQADEERKRSDFYLDVMGHDINNLNQTAILNLDVLQSATNLNQQTAYNIENTWV